MRQKEKTPGRNEVLVLDVLKRSDGPMSAYAILDRLREKGMRAPPQVYRALDRLVGEGRVHRLESLNAFVACADPRCHGGATAFAICDKCGQVSEFPVPGIGDQLTAWSRKTHFREISHVIELHGCCADCE